MLEDFLKLRVTRRKFNSSIEFSTCKAKFVIFSNNLHYYFCNIINTLTVKRCFEYGSLFAAL